MGRETSDSGIQSAVSMRRSEVFEFAINRNGTILNHEFIHSADHTRNGEAASVRSGNELYPQAVGVSRRSDRLEDLTTID
jgi:hypothetical protein